jgi:hypothetical protein
MVRAEALRTAKGTAICCSFSVVWPTATRSSLPSQCGFSSRSAFSSCCSCFAAALTSVGFAGGPPDHEGTACVFIPGHSRIRASAAKLTIKRGLKRRARKRRLIIDRETKQVLEALLDRIPLRLRVHKPSRSHESTRTLDARSADSETAPESLDAPRCRAAFSPAHISDRGGRTHRSVYIAVRRRAR